MKIIFLLGAAFSAYLFYALVSIHDRLLSWWNVLNLALFIVTLLCAGGLRNRRRWAFFLSLILAVAALGFGCYIVHFVWTFWIFEKPTFLDRVLSTLHPRVSVFILFPVLWLLFFSRQSVREQFQK